ncbi:unannotated protein [freshwater metagenome]|uniref:Unannotated protein n=1 Tax=freshwater metagenome TaxID=449393 RepID=A0A6J7BXU3_9ZZZZ|nr:hypothetical protein [Actinomycetota bacterium]
MTALVAIPERKAIELTYQAASSTRLHLMRIWAMSPGLTAGRSGGLGLPGGRQTTARPLPSVVVNRCIGE